MPKKTEQPLTVTTRYIPPEEGMGERICQARKQLGFNYEQLARLTAAYDAPDYKKGLTAAMLARYEKGFGGKPVLPGARELRMLCQALDVSADWLLFGIDTTQPAQTTLALAKATRELIDLAGVWQATDGTAHSWNDAERSEKVRRARKPDEAT